MFTREGRTLASRRVVRREKEAADYESFELGGVVLQSGVTLRGPKLAYKRFGTEDFLT
jgi:hypothetical protein